jgi:hypothetical protein
MARTTEQVRLSPVISPSSAEIDLPTTHLLQPEEPQQTESPQVLLPTPDQFATVAAALSESRKPTDQEAFSSVSGFFDLATRPLSLHPARQHILQAMNCLAWARAMRTQTWVREPTTYPVGVQWRALTLHRDTIATFGQAVRPTDNHGVHQETINLLTMLSLLPLPTRHQAITANKIESDGASRSLWNIARAMNEDLWSQESKSTYSSFWEYCQASAFSVNHLIEVTLSQN